MFNDWSALATAPRFVSFDTETTGLEPQKDQLLEIGAVLIANNIEIASLSLLIKPSIPIPNEASQVNGIYAEMVASAMNVTEAISCFEYFISDYPLVGQNVGFDIGFIEAALGYKLKNHAFCTAEIARSLLPKQQRYSLRALCSLFGVENNQAHRALSDARATAEVALALIKHGQNPPPMYTFYCIDKDAYAKRETLKQLGFRWNPEDKRWFITISKDELVNARTNTPAKGLRIYGFSCEELAGE